MKGVAVVAAALGLAALAVPPPLTPSPQRAEGMPPGPDPGAKITAAYAKHVGRDVYFWAWPMLAAYARRVVASTTHETVMTDALPQAPLNSLGMMAGLIDPAQRRLPAPDQDAFWGIGTLALDVSPVVLQAPDFGGQFWVYQVADARGESFARLGSMYDDTAGMFLLVGPSWKGETPKGIKRVFRSSTGTGTVVARVASAGTPAERTVVEDALKWVAMYPLSEYDGTLKTVQLRNRPRAPASKGTDALQGIDPETTFDVLADVLEDSPALPGEEARYAQVLAVLEAAQQNPSLKQAMIQGAKESNEELVKPLFEYRSVGRQLAYHWSMIDSGGVFGTDYFNRTASARSNAFPPAPNEIAVFQSDTDGRGGRLNGANRYTLTFPEGAMPPGALWSLSAYDENHFFEANALNRYVLGTNRLFSMKSGDDGSLTILIQSHPPDAKQAGNWLPCPRIAFSLVLRIYGPKAAVLDGTWIPPQVRAE